MDNKKVFESGAQRSMDADDYAFDLIHPEFERRIARVLKTGGEKYGRHNWERGMDVMDTMNHLRKHITDWLDGDDSCDNLANVACNLMFIMTWEKTHPELFEGIRRKDGKLTPEMLERMKRTGDGKKSTNEESVEKSVEKSDTKPPADFIRFCHENLVPKADNILLVKDIVNAYRKECGIEPINFDNHLSIKIYPYTAALRYEGFAIQYSSDKSWDFCLKNMTLKSEPEKSDSINGEVLVSCAPDKSELEESTIRDLFDWFYQKNVVQAPNCIIPWAEISEYFRQTFHLEERHLELLLSNLKKNRHIGPDQVFTGVNYIPQIIDLVPHKMFPNFYMRRIPTFMRTEFSPGPDGFVSRDELSVRFQEMYGINHLQFFHDLDRLFPADRLMDNQRGYNGKLRPCVTLTAT